MRKRRKRFSPEKASALFDECYDKALKRLPPYKPPENREDFTIRTIFFTKKEIRRAQAKRRRVD